jgi:hypothetical protein
MRAARFIISYFVGIFKSLGNLLLLLVFGVAGIIVALTGQENYNHHFDGIIDFLVEYLTRKKSQA